VIKTAQSVVINTRAVPQLCNALSSDIGLGKVYDIEELFKDVDVLQGQEDNTLIEAYDVTACPVFIHKGDKQKYMAEVEIIKERIVAEGASPATHLILAIVSSRPQTLNNDSFFKQWLIANTARVAFPGEYNRIRRTVVLECVCSRHWDVGENSCLEDVEMILSRFCNIQTIVSVSGLDRYGLGRMKLFLATCHAFAWKFGMRFKSALVKTVQEGTGSLETWVHLKPVDLLQATGADIGLCNLYEKAIVGESPGLERLLSLCPGQTWEALRVKWSGVRPPSFRTIRVRTSNGDMVFAPCHVSRTL